MLAELFVFQNITALLIIFALEMVLGFDNLLYISIQSRRAPLADQERVRSWGIIAAVIMRVVLLWVIVHLMAFFTDPFFSLNLPEGHNNINLPFDWIKGEFTFTTLVFLIGGGFLIYAAIKEIHHLLSIDDIHEEKNADRKVSSFGSILMTIMIMNLVFSFDSTLTALAISDVFIIQAIGIIGSGIAMYLIAEPFTTFITKNRMYEVIGLFILLMIGVSLLGEGGHLGHIEFFGHAVEPIAKPTLYFAMAVLVIVELIQTRFKRKLAMQRQQELEQKQNG